MSQDQFNVHVEMAVGALEGSKLIVYFIQEVLSGLVSIVGDCGDGGLVVKGNEGHVHGGWEAVYKVKTQQDTYG